MTTSERGRLGGKARWAKWEAERGTPEQRFWNNVKIGGLEECWPWLKSTVDGYGQTKIGGKDWRAHRYAYMLVFGPIQEGMQVCHKCDNRACCSPLHLFLGTALDNAKDCIAKGRDRKLKGSEVPWSKLTPEAVSQCRKSYIPGHPKFGAQALADRFNVNHGTMWRAIIGKSWKVVAPSRNVAANYQHKLNEDIISEIKREYIRGHRRFGARPLGRKYGVDMATIVRAVTGRTWKHLFHPTSPASQASIKSFKPC